MKKEYTEDIESIVTYGHEKIDPNEKVEVNLKDLLYVYSTLQEYVRYFHQPMHYPTIEDLHEFLGSKDEPKGFKVLTESVYKKMRGMFPKHISEMYGEGELDHPTPPFYYKPKES